MMTTEGDALDTAVEDAEQVGADYEVPVALVRARVRHRRRTRAVVRGSVAVAAVAAVTATLPATLTWEGANGTLVASLADWPAEFDRCGQPPDLAPDDDAAPFTTTLEESDGTIGADRVALTEAQVDIRSAPDVEVHFGGAEVSLLRDGLVVAVEEPAAPVVVALSELDAVTESGPARWTFGTGLVSCAQYPDGSGDPRVPGGEYELVVTHTIDWHAPDGTEHSTRVSRTMPVTVTEDAPATTVDPTACVADPSVLEGLTGTGANALPMALGIDAPVEVATDDVVRVGVTATNTGTVTLDGTVEQLAVVLVQDGRVVGTPSWSQAVDAEPLTLAPGTSTRYGATAPLAGCTTPEPAQGPGPDAGSPVPSGEYELWVVMDVRPTGTGPDAEADRVVGGPQPLRVR